MSEPDLCPLCGADLAYEHDGKTYSHLIGVEIPGLYDGTLFWQCPFCEGRWHKFPEGHHYRKRAEPYVHPEEKSST